jgi:uncharacterized membrane protein
LQSDEVIMPTTTFAMALMAATFLCSLVAGFLFAFAVVVMPGLRRLDDGEFIRTFQAIDRVIQNNQPMFVLVWVGSVIALLAAAVFGLWAVSGVNRVLVIVAAVFYLIGVQAPTVAINIPLNNQLQKLDARAMNETARQHARAAFELRWNRWNRCRTAFAAVVAAQLIVLLLRI